jgi:glycogenin glucosyltransferase
MLDADTIVVQNVDELFDRPAIAAAPDFFLPDRFSSGVMVLEPNRDTFATMVQELSRFESCDGGDQGFLNNFFAGWYAKPVEHRLPIGYNMAHFIYQFMHAHPSAWDKLQGEVKIIHYLVQKPWQAKSTLSGASDLWWKAYFAAHPGEHHEVEQRLHQAEDRTFDLLAKWIVG